MKLKIWTFFRVIVTVSELLHMFSPIDLVGTGRRQMKLIALHLHHSDVSEDDQEYRELGHYESL